MRFFVCFFGIGTGICRKDASEAWFVVTHISTILRAKTLILRQRVKHPKMDRRSRWFCKESLNFWKKCGRFSLVVIYLRIYKTTRRFWRKIRALSCLLIGLEGLSCVLLFPFASIYRIELIFQVSSEGVHS